MYSFPQKSVSHALSNFNHFNRLCISCISTIIFSNQFFTISQFIHVRIVNRTILTTLLLILIHPLFSQEIERKIILANDCIYYTTIDTELQISTLHVGNLQNPLNKARELGMPAGRNYSFPINPFCWDIVKKNVFAINFVNNSMNIRNKALKFFPLSGLNKWSKTNTPLNLLTNSFENNFFADFEPYNQVTDRSAILENFFFDGVALSDSTVCIVMANRGEISVWNYNTSNWIHSDFINLHLDNYFSLFTYDQTVYMVLNTGKIYSVSQKGIVELPDKKLNCSLSEGALIIDKEKNAVKFIKFINLNFSKPFAEIIKEHAITIF